MPESSMTKVRLQFGTFRSTAMTNNQANTSTIFDVTECSAIIRKQNMCSEPVPLARTKLFP